MGFGVSLTFVAIGAILAFAVRVDVSGVSLQAIGWILITVGVISTIVTFAYTRPRRRGRVTEVVEEDPVDVVRSGEAERKTYVHPDEGERRTYVRPAPGARTLPGTRRDHTDR